MGQPIVIKKIGHRNTFKETAEYILRTGHGQDAHPKPCFGGTRHIFGGPDSAAWEMMLTAQNRDALRTANGEKIRKGGRPLKGMAAHWVISYGDNPRDRNRIKKDVAELLHRLGLAEHESLFVLHTDNGTAHVHILANRIHPKTGKLATDSGDVHKSEKLRQKWCNEIEALEAANRAAEWSGPAQGWAGGKAGYDGLTGEQKDRARKAWQAWRDGSTKERPRTLDLAEYVAYVQARAEERPQPPKIDGAPNKKKNPARLYKSELIELFKLDKATFKSIAEDLRRPVIAKERREIMERLRAASRAAYIEAKADAFDHAKIYFSRHHAERRALLEPRKAWKAGHHVTELRRTRRGQLYAGKRWVQGRAVYHWPSYLERLRWVRNARDRFAAVGMAAPSFWSIAWRDNFAATVQQLHAAEKTLIKVETKNYAIERARAARFEIYRQTVAAVRLQTQPERDAIDRAAILAEAERRGFGTGRNRSAKPATRDPRRRTDDKAAQRPRPSGP